MTTTDPSPTPDKEALATVAFWVAVVVLIAAAATGAYSYYLSRLNHSSLGLTSAYLLLAMCGVTVVSALLSRVGVPRWGMRLLIVALLLFMPATSTLVAGAGVVFGLAVIAATTTIAALTLGPRQTRWTIMASFISGVFTLLIDLYWPINRIDLPLVFQRVYLPLIALAVIAIYGLLVARQLPAYTLRTKLIIAFVGVALLPLGLLAYLNSLTVQASLTAAADRSLVTAATQTASALDAFFVEASSVVRTESGHAVLQEYLTLSPEQRAASDAEQKLAALLAIFAQKGTPTEVRILSYMLLDRAGRVVGATSPEEVGQDKSDHDYFKVAFSRTSYTSPLDFADPSHGDSVFFSAPVRDVSSEPIGVLVAQYQFDLQQAAAEKNNLAGPQSYAMLLDENHIRLAHGTHPELVYQSVVPLPEGRLEALWAANRLPVPPDQVLSTALPDLEKQLTLADARSAGAAPVAFTDQNTAAGTTDQVAVVKMTSQPWSVVFVQPQKVFLAPAVEQTRNTLLLGVLITGLVTLAAMGISRYLTGPLTRLRGVASKVSGGDLTAQARVESEDEIGQLADTFNSMTAQLRQTLAGLEHRVAERTAQLQAAADISRAATAMRDLNELLRLALALIRERFGFYHASIFLMDEAGEFAVLRESTGEVGAQLKAKGHRLGVGSHSLVGWVTQNRHPRVALDVAGDPFHFQNPLLPDTRSELCIPLIVGDQLLGVLDVQSTKLNAFSESMVQVLQTLADQLSVAILNANLFQRTQASLQEVSALYQQVTSTAWHTLLLDQPRELVFDLEPGGRPAADADGAPLTIPLRLGEETLGTIELHGWRTSDIGPEEQAILDTIATQISVALESAALFQDTQRRRNREQLINEITYRMRATLDPASIVQSGIRELGRALGATEVVVKIQPPARSPSIGPGRGPQES
jgi:GAF domain-containing protein/C4-dicarboxylate-specific signal transduction histidine kinase